MRSKDDGGPAFPSTTPNEQFAFANTHHPGMTLRDYFAALALPLGWEIEKERPTGPFCEHMEPRFLGAAQRAYFFADAMLKAREAK